jgi:hypothetical protein
MSTEKKKLLPETEQKPIEVEDDIGRKFVAVIEEHLFEVYPNLDVLPGQWWFPLWELYDRSLSIPEAFQEQRAYDLNRFLEALIDPEYIKVVSLQDQKLIGMMMGTTNLEKAKVNYINTDFLRVAYPEAAEKNRILYMTTGYFSSELRNVGFLNWVISLIAQIIAQYCDVFVGDVSTPRYFLKDAIRYGAERAGVPIKREDILGTQTYFAFVLGE